MASEKRVLSEKLQFKIKVIQKLLQNTFDLAFLHVIWDFNNSNFLRNTTLKVTQHKHSILFVTDENKISFLWM